jgi:hypothetical protein
MSDQGATRCHNTTANPDVGDVLLDELQAIWKRREILGQTPDRMAEAAPGTSTADKAAIRRKADFS